MAYWLFYIMDFVTHGDGWKKQVEWGVAAQHYPTLDWTGADQNMPLLRKIKRGDWIVVGRACRFGGYGKATSDFYQGGRSLKIVGREEFEFRERVDVEWRIVPGYESFKNWLDLHDFKRELLNAQRKTGGSSSYSPIDFPVGRCLKEIDADLFQQLRKRLDKAGAQPVGQKRSAVDAPSRMLPATFWDEMLDKEPAPARQSTAMVTRPVRDPRNRLAAKERAGWSCEVPGCRIPKFLQKDTRRPYVEAHHLDPIGKKGVEHLSNTAVVCAWHHAVLTHGRERDAERIAKQLRTVRRTER